MKKIIKLTFIGIMMGCTINVILGIGFTLPSLIYDKENISFPLKLFIHMTIGFIIYICCAYKANWIPIELGIIPVLISFIISIFIAFIIWFGFYLYLKKEADNINKNLKENEKEA